MISIAFFKLLGTLGKREATILENNVVQTAGSSGESLAFGVGVTMPAILILGFDLEITRVMLVASLGGLLGILMMIPLRRALIVAQHGTLKYPEGTACAEVLKAGASPESQAAADPAAVDSRIGGISARTIFTGFGIGLAYKALNVAFKGWKDAPGMTFGAPLKGGSVAAEVSPELLGVGYIIGPRVAAMMFAGGFMTYLLLIPMILFFGQQMQGVIAPGTKPIGEMTPGDVRNDYILYIGAGAVATAGIIALIRAIPLIAGSIKAGIRDVSAARSGKASTDRRDQDLSLKFVGIGMLNPSHADETRDDPTIRQARARGRQAGFSALIVWNLFAFRATLPADLKRAGDPVGPANDAAIELALGLSHRTILAWGNHGAHLARDRAVLAQCTEADIAVLGLTGAGQPRHPLYLPRGTRLRRWVVQGHLPSQR